MIAFPFGAGRDQKGRFWYFREPEFRLARALLDYDIVSYELAYLVMFGDREDQPCFKSVHVYVCALRKKLAGFDIAITTRQQFGYQLTSENRERLTQLFDEWGISPLGIPVLPTVKDRVGGVAMVEHREQVRACARKQQAPPAGINLTRTELCFVELLLRHTSINRAVLYNALYGHLTEADKPEITSINALASKLRRKLREQGILLAGTSEDGWSLGQRDRASLVDLIEDQQ